MKTKVPLPCFTFPMVYPLNKVLREHNMQEMCQKEQVHAKPWPKKFTKIDLFYIDHNAHCLPPKLCISIMFDFPWDDLNTQEKMETMVMQNLGGGGVDKVHDCLCENGKYNKYTRNRLVR